MKINALCIRIGAKPEVQFLGRVSEGLGNVMIYEGRSAETYTRLLYGLYEGDVEAISEPPHLRAGYWEASAVLKSDEDFRIVRAELDAGTPPRIVATDTAGEDVTSLHIGSFGGSRVFLREDYLDRGEIAGESERTLRAFERFFSALELATAHGERGPVFIFDLFGRLDERVELTPYLDRLHATDRQVFISAPSGFP